MFGNVMGAAQTMRQRHGPGRGYELRTSMVPISRKKWKNVDADTYSHHSLKFVWQPGATMYCPFCDTTKMVGSKHFSDCAQGCRPVLACEKLQHKFHLLTRHHGHPTRWLSVSSVFAMQQQGLNLESIHRQEELWLPNEDIFEYDNARNWVSTGFNICQAFDNLPGHLRMEPWPQDLTAVNNQDMMVFGADVYANHRIRDRYFERMSDEKEAANKVVEGLIDGHDQGFHLVDRYKFQIANFKQHVLSELNNNNLTPAQVVAMMAFFDMPGQPHFIPAANNPGGPTIAANYIPIPRANIVTNAKTAGNRFVNDNLAYILGPPPTHM